MTYIVSGVALAALWVLVLWPRKSSDRAAIREYDRAREALRRVVER